MSRQRLIAMAALAIVAVAMSGARGAGTVQAQTSGERLEISAFAVNMSNIATGANAVVQIRIDSWSTDKEREHLITTFLEKGEDSLLRELQRARVVGRWNIPGFMGPDIHQLRLGHDIRYTRQAPLPDGGRQINIVTDRYIGFAEARNQPRSIDYPFTLMEIRVNKAGEGEGKAAIATKISFDKKKNAIELENYSSEPVRLNNVRVRPRT